MSKEINDSNEMKELVNSLFIELGHVCGNHHIPGCGSYLFNGSTYEYYHGMFKKQKLLFDLAKDAKNVLEIGTYMGHSLAIMLLANPMLKATCVDISDRYSGPAVSLLRQKFPLAEIKFVCKSSIDAFSEISDKFDLFHIDGTHENEIVLREFELCKKHCANKTMKVVFDDADGCRNTLSKIESEHKVLEKIVPNCDWTNAYLHLEL